ncbi:MAG: ribbon-helix-helix protein, CopG family [Actinobacteria bacterium]|nr:ribbon-helix-helix protein, CopG family [Actinomycetota bacterium]
MCYHNVLTRKATTVRLPEDLAETAEIVARARGVSVNQVILDAIQAEVDRVRQDEEFMGLLHTLVERDKEILDRLAE